MFFFIFYILDCFLTYVRKIILIKVITAQKYLLPIIIFFITLLINFIILKVYYQSYGSIELNQLSKLVLKDIISLSHFKFLLSFRSERNFFIFIYISFILIIQKNIEEFMFYILRYINFNYK